MIEQNMWRWTDISSGKNLSKGKYAYLSSKSQIAIVLTKRIPREDFKDNVDKLGMIDIYALT